MIGVTIGEMTVDTAVSETDNARSPFARNVITSDAVPPGTVPTRIRPTVNPASSENMLARAKAMRGMLTYCADTHTRISFGLLKTVTKSFIFKVVPMPKRIIPKRIFITLTPINSSKTQLKDFGSIMAITTAINMIIKKYFSTNLKNLFINLIFVKSVYKFLD